MPPIPIHKNDPIAPVAAKPDGITPQTANPPPTRTTPASAPATTTASSNPPPPQPGARPLAPTASSIHPSSTPPAPQPGAVPTPSYTATHTVTETRLGGPPPQSFIPPPSDTQLLGRSTTTSSQTPSKPGPTTLNYGPVASAPQSEHTGGAVLGRASGEERRSLEHPPGYRQGMDHSPYVGTGTNTTGGGADGGVGGTAWGLLSKAGEVLKKGEEAAWRAARGK